MSREAYRFDRALFKADAIYDPVTGYLRTDASFTRVGVFEYALADGSKRREFRPPNEVGDRASLESLALVPVTNDHPAKNLDSGNAREFAVGSVGDYVWLDEGQHVRGRISVWDTKAQDEIRAGKRELSCGYRLVLDETPGEWNGISYDAIQRNIVYDHVAIVEAGRAGPTVKINVDRRDGAEEQTQEPITYGVIVEGRKDSMEFEYHADAKKFRFEGVAYDLSTKDGVQALKDAFAEYLKKKKAELKTKDGENEPREDSEALVKLLAQVDSYKEKIDDLQAKLDARSDAEIAKRVSERVALEAFARACNVERTDGLSDLDLKTECLVSAAHADRRDALRATLKERGEAYTIVRFDMLKEEKANENEARKKTNDVLDGRGDKSDEGKSDEDGTNRLDEARKKQAQRFEFKRNSTRA